MTKNPLVAVVDYGAGNLRSVAKALERSGLHAEVTSDPQAVSRADAVVLPGVGAFADCAGALRSTGLEAPVRDGIAQGKPYLGLCIGLQLLFEQGEEDGITPGLGVLSGKVARFPATDIEGHRLLVPHIGWNEVSFAGEHPMIERLPAADHYYFVHSYRAEGGDPAQVVGTANYGGEFTAAVASDNVFAVQFHPEKSQMAGKRLLDAFRSWLEAT